MPIEFEPRFISEYEVTCGQRIIFDYPQIDMEEWERLEKVDVYAELVVMVGERERERENVYN